MHLKIKGSFFVFISALLYGSYGVWSVLLGKEFGVFFQGYMRAALVLIVLIPTCYFTKNWVPMKWSDMKSFAWCLGFLVFSQAPIYYAYQNAGVGIINLVFFGSYLLAAYVIGYFLLGEKLHFVKILSFIIAFIGLYVTFAGSFGAYSLLALVMGGLSGVSGGGGMSATKLISKKFSSLQILIVTWGVSFIVHLPVSLILHERQLVPTLSLLWLALLGFAVAGVLSSWFLVEGLRHVDASIGGLISLLEVVIAITFGYLFFSEKILLSTIMGAILVMVAVAIPQFRELTKRK